MHGPAKNWGPFFYFMLRFAFEILKWSHDGNIPFQLHLITITAMMDMNLFSCTLLLQGEDPSTLTKDRLGSSLWIIFALG